MTVVSGPTRGVRGVVLACMAMLVMVSGMAARVAAQTDPGSMALVDRSPWVAAEDTLNFALAVTNAEPDLMVRLRIDEPVSTAAELTASLREDTGTPIHGSVRAVDELPLDAAGNRQFAVTVTDQPVSDADAATRFRLRDPGVYPAVLTLQRGDGTVLATIRTPIARAATADEDPGAVPLAVVVHVGLRPTRTPDGSRTITTDELDRLDRLAALLSTPTGGLVPAVTLDVVPDTLAALGRVDDARATRILDALAGVGASGANARRAVLVQTYLPLPRAALAAVGLASAVAIGVDVGRPILADAVAGRLIDPDPARDALDGIAVDRALSAELAAPAPARPDAGAIALAHALVDADLDAAQRVVVIDDADADSNLAALFATPTAGRPLDIEPFDPIADQAPEVSATPAPAADLTAIAPDVVATTFQLSSVRSLVGTDHPTVIDAQERLLTSIAVGVPDPDRAAYLTTLDTDLSTLLDGVSIAGQTDLNLTSRRGTLPITIANTTGGPVDVVVKLRSDRLSFPDGESIAVRVEGESHRLDVPVTALATGSVPTFVELRTPDDAVQLDQRQLNVRSSAISGTGLVLSLGALGVLIVWWGRTWRRNRRAMD